MSESADLLLYAISGRGSMRWESFKRAFHTLRRTVGEGTPAGNDDIEPRLQLLQCVRSLGGLGHCDFDFSGSGVVYVAPPALVRLPWGGTITAVLSGARTEATVDRMRKAVSSSGVELEISASPSSTFGVPRCISAKAIAVSAMGVFASEAGVEFIEKPPAWQIANFSAHIEDFSDQLNWLPATPPDWESCAFDPVSLRFNGQVCETDEIRLTRHEHRGRWQYALWKDGMRASADLDWARYAVAESRGLQLACYDVRSCVLAVPAAAPLPTPLARAACLCSGHPPARSFSSSRSPGIVQTDQLMNLHRGVPVAIAELIAEKLGLQLRHTLVKPAIRAL